ncbi:hypothetical protein [Riemerella columbipharyngis]|uniref:Right handed beta helix region n=1 Tax=Riemerella columbipharyngis TaxID=1071918 RepID=A0A1G7BRG5_9FLAO|nr:hypothetical protein [Riemerella columbipharyngis]SDE28785.1 hypothetical protein SAMN05421544_10667 [Riemerella columbipharyngis]
MKWITAFLIWGSLFLLSCRDNDISFENLGHTLRFSKDTLTLDTVFSQTRSETYAVKVYNNENKDVVIPEIVLEKGENSMFRINVDGTPGVKFTQVSLRKKDSLYIFVEIAPNAHQPIEMAEDKIMFSNGQHITLRAAVQDAEYIISTKEHPKVISENTVWNNDKVKIIYGSLTLAEGKTLTIMPGTKVYFYKNSGLTVAKNAFLDIRGELKKEVLLRGDRTNSQYDTIPANWEGVKFQEGAVAKIDYAKIFGGNTALSLEKSRVSIKNTILYNFQNYGIYAQNSNVDAENLVMNSFGNTAVKIENGGTYNFIHSTIANYWYHDFAGGNLCLDVSNAYTMDKGKTSSPLSLSLLNSIIFNNKNNSIVFNIDQAQPFDYLIQNSLANYSNESGFVWDNNARVINSIGNKDPEFENTHNKKLSLRLKKDSPAKAKGDAAVAQHVPKDIAGVSRLVNPNMGAYQ